MRPVGDVVGVAGGKQQRVALVDLPAVQLLRVTTAANKQQLDDTRGPGQFVKAVLDTPIVHGHHLDIATDPFRALHPDVAELDILTGDVATNTLSDSAVGRLGGQGVQ